MTQREIRKALYRNGHIPTPVSGKRPILNDWPRLAVDEGVIDDWGEAGNGTGAVCSRTAGFDLDILDEGAVRIVLELMRSTFSGTILERTGLAPKVLVPVYIPQPFRKIIKKFRAPDGSIHKIELLCDGQQFVVEGIHPDTQKPYTWRGPSLTDVSLMHLPVVNEEGARAFIDRCAAELKSQLGWLDVSSVAVSAAADPNNVVQFAPVSERIEKMQYGGEFPINDTLLAYSGDQLRNGVACEGVIKDCLARVQKTYDEIPGDPQERPIWDWNKIRLQIEAMVYGYIKKNHTDQPRIIETLPHSMLEKWRSIEAAGGTPCFQKRRYWGVEDSGPADPLPIMDAPPTVPVAEKTRRHRPANVLVPFKAFDVASLPRRCWLLDQHYT